MVDLLERARAPAHLGRAAAEHHERRAVELRAGEGAHPVGDPGAGGQRGDAGLAGRLRVALGRPGRRLLVAGVDQVDALGDAAVVDREQVAAGEREQLRDAAVGERAGDQLAAVDRALVGAGRAALGAGALLGRRHRSRDYRPMSPPAPGRVLFAASLGFFVVILDVTIVNVALPSIGDDLGADLSELQWVVDAYVVAFAALLLSAGAFADRIGVARCYSVGMVAFTLASIVCGASPSLELLLVARFLQGVAAALLLPSSLALVRLAYADPGERAKAIGIWAAMGGIALAAGPVVGGVLTGAVDWRAIFFLNIPVGIAALVANAHGAALGADPHPARPPGPDRGDPRRRRADLRGDRGRPRRDRLAGARSRRSSSSRSRLRRSWRSSAVRPTRRCRSTSSGPAGRDRRDRHRPAVQLRLLRPGLRPQPLLPGRARPRPGRQRADVPAAHRADRRGQRLVGRCSPSRHGPRPPLIAGQLAMIVGLLAMLALDDDTPTALILRPAGAARRRRRTRRCRR